MGKIKRQGLGSSLFLYIGMMLGFLNTGILFPKILPPEILGFAQFLAKMSNLLGIISLLGLPVLTIRFFPSVRNKREKHQGYFLFILLIGMASSFLLVLLMGLFSDTLIGFFTQNGDEEHALSNQLIRDHFWGMLVWVFFNNLVILLTSYTTALQRPRIPAFLSEVFGRLVTTALLLGYFWNIIDQQDFVTLYAFKPLPIVLGLAGFLMLIGEFHWYLSRRLFRENNMKAWTNFGVYATFSQIGERLTTSIDTVMITKFLNLANTGIYNVFQLLCTTIIMTHKGMGRIASPLIAEYWEKGEMGKIEALYKRMALLNLTAALLMYIGILANLDNAVLFYDEAYAIGRPVAIFLGAAQVLHVLNGYNGLILVYSPLYRFELYFKLATGALTVITNYYFIRSYGIAGAALATAITVLLTNLMNQWFVYRSYRIHPFSRPMVKVLSIAGLVLVIALLVPRLSALAVIDAAIRSLGMVLLYVGLVLAWRVSDDINNAVRNYWQKLADKLP